MNVYLIVRSGCCKKMSGCKKELAEKDWLHPLDELLSSVAFCCCMQKNVFSNALTTLQKYCAARLSSKLR